MGIGGPLKKQQGYRVKIKVGDAEVDVEGAQEGVVKIVETLSEVLRGARRSPAVLPAPPSPTTATPAPRSTSIDIRSFFEEKQPSSDVEAAAATAFYRQFLAPEGQRTETIDSEYLQEAFRQARRRLPARAIYTLTNARNAGYLDSGGGPGQFRLNPVGYNLVEHTLGSSKSEAKAGTRAKHRRKGAKK